MNIHEYQAKQLFRDFLIPTPIGDVATTPLLARNVAEDIPGWSVANKDNMTVALDINVTPELQEEGNARELVNRIQKIRKESGLDVTDRINVNIQDFPTLNSAIINYSDYICAEILADSINILPIVENGEQIEVNDVVLNVFINKTS